MDSEALAHIYGYGYEASTADGRIPYSYNYNLDYDYPIPNWADPRWAPNPHSPVETVYAPQFRTTGAYGQVVRLSDTPEPLERSLFEMPAVRSRPRHRLYILLFAVALLLLVFFGALGLSD